MIWRYMSQLDGSLCGGFGEVFRAEWHKADVACKKLLEQRRDDKGVADFEKELMVHSNLSHPCIVTLRGACTEPGKLMIVTDFMENGSLFDRLGNGDPLSRREAVKIAIDIAKGMSYLTSRGVIHRDLKSANVLLDQDGKAKLSDFGLSRMKCQSSTLANSVGTAAWMAPELFDDLPIYSEASDVYAFAILLWEILSSKRPFEGCNPARTLGLIMQGKRPSVNGLDPTDPLVVLMKRCWDQNPQNRLSFQEILSKLGSLQQHLFIKPTRPSPSVVTRPKVPAPRLVSPLNPLPESPTTTTRANGTTHTEDRPPSSSSSSVVKPTPRKERVSNGDFVHLNQKLSLGSPKLTRDKYYSEPPLSILAEMNNEQLSRVPNFKVGMRGRGFIVWDGETDVRGVDLDKAVVFDEDKHAVDVYPDDPADNKMTKPPVGTKLNKPALVVLDNVFPKKKKDPTPEDMAKWKERIRASTEKAGAEFIDFNGETGRWQLRVSHFSRWGLDEDESEDEGQPQRPQPTRPQQQQPRPVIHQPDPRMTMPQAPRR
mmetsp:Transcript_25840/g.42413  ORF Transcript_25840/g.42413 Transcript_25840/m.42413 type:complete len:541 (+) Transcript_25840:765-2387(+)